MARGAVLRFCTELDPGGTPVVRVEGEVDLSSAHRLYEVCREQRRAGHAVVVLDCSMVAFMDSTGLNACVRLNEELAAQGGRLELRSVPPHMARLLVIAGLRAALAVSDLPPEPGA